MLRKKKELQDAGIAKYDDHPEYRRITHCKSEDDIYPSNEDCNRKSPLGKPATTGKRKRCQKGTTFNKRTQNCEPTVKRPKSKGTKRNKRTKPNNKQGSPGPREDESKPKKFARCPNGTRRNKKTQNCE